MTAIKQRVNKSKKRNWRKHVDIQDVEDHLEDQRLQERTGGLVAEKTDEQLFFIDNTTSENKASPASGRRNRRDVHNLKCHSGLLPDPKITPARVAHNVSLNSARQLCNAAQERLKSGELPAKKKQALQQSRIDHNKSRKKKFQKNRPNIASYDLWANESVDGNDYLTEGTDHYMKVTRKRRVNVPKHHRIQPSGLPAVEIAHPGASYNPDVEQYQELLASAHNFEVVKNKKEDQITHALHDKFPVAGEAPTQETYIEEMSAGLFDDENEYQETTECDDIDRLSVNPPVRREDKKTTTQRNKDKRKKDAELKIRKEKERKAKKNEMMRLKSLKKAVRQVELEKAEHAKHKAEIKEKYKDKPKILGKLKYEAPEIEIKLTDELQPTLRELKPEGHLLEDRFKSLQRRNIIEPRKRAKRTRKYKLKQFDNKSHRNVT